MDTLINRNLIEEWCVPCTLRCARGQEYECCAISDYNSVVVLCRMRAHPKCSYFSNFSTRGADSVVVSAYDWHAGGPALMPRRSTPVIFGINTNRQRMTQLNCASGGAMLCATPTRLHKTYTNVAQAAIPLYNGRPMCVPKGYIR